jgi:hypothetical protein
VRVSLDLTGGIGLCKRCIGPGMSRVSVASTSGRNRGECWVGRTPLLDSAEGVLGRAPMRSDYGFSVALPR